jgi:hypothetical protein
MVARAIVQWWSSVALGRACPADRPGGQGTDHAACATGGGDKPTHTVEAVGKVIDSLAAETARRVALDGYRGLPAVVSPASQTGNTVEPHRSGVPAHTPPGAGHHGAQGLRRTAARESPRSSACRVIETSCFGSIIALRSACPLW